MFTLNGFSALSISWALEAFKCENITLFAMKKCYDISRRTVGEYFNKNRVLYRLKLLQLLIDAPPTFCITNFVLISCCSYSIKCLHCSKLKTISIFNCYVSSQVDFFAILNFTRRALSTLFLFHKFIFTFVLQN